MADLRKKLSSLSKLFVVAKIPKHSRPDLKSLLASMTNINEHETKVPIKERKVPDFLICQIKGDLMDDLVTIESGVTFEREYIKQHF